MILFAFIFQLYDISASHIIDKKIYLMEGEDYKVNLDSIFKEDQENIYSFKSSDKGFTIDNSSLRLKSDQGTYSKLPTKILRERQLINLDDYQGQGQFGILDQHDSGHRICYNNDSMINLDQCIELDSTATSYDFVFIDRNTVAVSMVRDQQFGVKIYKNKEQISELFFIPSKTYNQVTKTIIEYCVFEKQKYLMFGVPEEQNSNIEFLQIQDDSKLTNTNKVIDKSLMPDQQTLQLYDIKGTVNKVYVVGTSTQQAKLILSFTFKKEWTKQEFFISQDFRGFELGYSFISHSVVQTYLRCQQDSYEIRFDKQLIFKNFNQQIKSNAQVKYTLNYLIVLQDNQIMVTPLQKSAQRATNMDETILKIDVDFQNDVLMVFTDTKIMAYYLKQATLSYSSDKITNSLDLMTIQAQSGQFEQTANIHFQILSKIDYNPYLLMDLTQDLYYNRLFDTTFITSLQGMSGEDIQVDGIVDDQVQLIPKNQKRYGLQTQERNKKKIIQEYLMTDNFKPYLFRQFEDFSYSIYQCWQINLNSYYQCLQPDFSDSFQQQKVTLQYFQVADQQMKFALLNSDGLEIRIADIRAYGIFKTIQTTKVNQFVDMKVGTDRLFVYTINYLIQIYYFPSGEFINQFSLSQFGLPKGKEITKLWVNQVKTNLIAISYGEDLIIGRFTTQFIFIQRITIKWVFDVNIIADNKFTVLLTDQTTYKLTQYIIEEGNIRIDRELDTHGYTITGQNILSDYVFGEIMIQAQKGPQKAILVFMDTELARDSLVKVIQLQDDEFPANVIYNQQLSSLLIRSTDSQKNSTIIDLIYRYQVFESNLTRVPTKFSQQLNLKYVYRSPFSIQTIESMKHFYLEYQFYIISVKQSQNKIPYENDQLNIPIQPDIFKGQVRIISKSSYYANVSLTTRFRNHKEIRILSVSQCNQVFSYDRIICLAGFQVIYLNTSGEIISQLNITITRYSSLIQMILRNDDKYALIRSDEEHLLLIYISKNKIELSKKIQQGWNSSFDVSIFYQSWLLVSDKTKLSYFKFQIEENDSWSLEKQNQYLIQGIQVIQYDPITEQLFYSTGNQYLYYFKSSLEGDTISKQLEYSLNLHLFLKSLNVFQVNVVIQNIKIITQYKKSFLFVSTSYCNIWNMTIKSSTQDFQVNNMYIVNERDVSERYPIVKDIQLIDDYVLVQTFQFQSLYQNTHDWQMNKPYLSLEGITGTKFIGLFKNGSQIIHYYIDASGYYLQQSNIDENMYLKVDNLTQYNPGNISIIAMNDFDQAQVNYQLFKEVKAEKQQFPYFLLAISIISVIAFLALVYRYKRRRQQVESQNDKPLVEFA